ncbi:glycosyltransferase [Vibrio crassostreae]|uniref:glycosyltransferase n=1 Tax=Vibrio crassostreae TaxID=246167 RepID=UPI001051BF0E|nr:glycosyltransferase [Vibrio crassostreae]TCN92825.1 glycosyltransferase involved in cell wall biosynthesis [Vibrio crassostreae]CAK1934199.1 Glycosyltransferase involved in cell wall biosynthesis [Vibrio crassostreae]CAK1942418.1 Glycosyltransferase involved in cell wall biosynthesis [Vibrio crassostreae]CAK1947780.1 Glycosyltransferase involved in cell wall biosynthesis [Vibrio crassostreae]CAK2709943.1 Glycosyltransferase involved in cell wall biosynthesis [Vibrio crassostreae]
MRVAVVVNCLKMGGMERVAVNLSDAFYEAGHDTELIYFKNRTREIEPRNKNIPIHLFNLKKSVLQTGVGIFWLALCKILNVVFRKTFPLWFAYAESIAFKRKLAHLEEKRGRFDLVIFRGQGTFEHVWRVKDSRFVYVCENVQKKYMYGKLSHWIFSNLFHNRNVVCVSQGALDSFKDLTETHHIKTKASLTLNNPNDFRRIEREASALLTPLHDKPFILGLGRLVPQKNFSLLVEAYARAVKKFGITQDLVIVGAGRDKDKIQETATKLGIADRVHFKGQQNNPFPWYKQADLFVLSSKFEGLGMVLIESLACGTKVVSTDSQGGVRQIMNGELEVYLSPEEPEALADKIMLGLDTPWDDKLDTFVKSTLLKFDGATIVQQYIEEFYS